MSTLHTLTRRFRIVVGIDLTEFSDIVLEHALDQAARHEAPELHFLTVCEKKRDENDVCKQKLWERVYPALETFNRHGREWRARLHVRRGKPEEEIAELAADVRADLIVIGQFGVHNPKPTDRNVPNRVLQHAGCPTLVVGFPSELDTAPACPLCSAIRENTEGDRWFCDAHTSSADDAPSITPMTIWTNGAFEIERAA